MKLAPVFVLPLLFAQQAPVVQDRDKASLEGQVLNAITGEPLRKTRLSLRMNVAQTQTARQQQPSGPAGIVVVSDAAGKFLFPNLDAGDYQLTARRDGFANAQLGTHDGKKKTEPIIFSPGDRKTGFTVKMTPHGAIAGRLADEDGDPIRGQHVALLTYQYTTKGRELIESSSTATTNDLGEYRIYDVPPGKYFLKAGSSQRSARTGASPDDPESFVSAYYPGSHDAAGAAPIDLPAGQQLRGLTLILRQARFATIRGRVIGPPGHDRICWLDDCNG